MQRTIIAVIVLLALAAGGFIWERHILHPKVHACGYCSRPLHANLRVTAEIDGKRADVCCAHCAITEANQLHRPLKLITVHDFSSGRPLAPQNGWYVEGSRANACEHDAMHMNEMKEMQDLAFDRCSPGTFAFASEDSAKAFVSQNGGTILTFADLMREVHAQ